MNGSQFLNSMLEHLAKLLGGDRLISEDRYKRFEFMCPTTNRRPEIQLGDKPGPKIQRAWNEALHQFSRTYFPSRLPKPKKVETPEEVAEAIFQLSLRNPFYRSRKSTGTNIRGQNVKGWEFWRVQDEPAYRHALNKLIDAFLMRLKLNEGIGPDLYTNFAHLASIAVDKGWDPEPLSLSADERRASPPKMTKA